MKYHEQHQTTCKNIMRVTLILTNEQPIFQNVKSNLNET